MDSENDEVVGMVVVKEGLEDIDLNEITPLIDWTFFFHAWQLKGRFPKILDDAEKGKEARKLYADATAMLQKIIDEKWLSANASAAMAKNAAIFFMIREIKS